MIDIARAYFHFDSVAPTEDDLIAYARRVFDKMDTVAEEILPFDDYSLYLAVEEGSLKGRSRVAVVATALYLGIGQYSDFVQGLETIARQGRAVARAIVAVASDDEIVPREPKGTMRVDAGAASLIERLFVKVRDREISPEEATRQALKILDPTGTELPPDAQREIATALESIRLNPEQLHLDLDAEEASEPPSGPSPRRKGPTPDVQHLIVVIERKKKRSQLQFRKEYR